MANNPYVNKVEYGGDTLIDISDTTATAADVASGKKFYLATGAAATGTASGGGGGTVTITDTTDTAGGTIRTITPTPGITTIMPLIVTSNNTYTAPTGYAYSPVTVNVSGGGSSYTLLGSAEFTVNTTSTSSITVGTIDCGSSVWTANYVLTTVEDKAGARNGYFISSSTWVLNRAVKNGTSSTGLSVGFGYPQTIYTGASGLYQNSSSAWAGVYGDNIKDGIVTFKARYNSSASGTINGTYICKVWVVTFPTGFNPWGE